MKNHLTQISKPTTKKHLKPIQLIFALSHYFSPSHLITPHSLNSLFHNRQLRRAIVGARSYSLQCLMIYITEGIRGRHKLVLGSLTCSSNSFGEFTFLTSLAIAGELHNWILVNGIVEITHTTSGPGTRHPVLSSSSLLSL